MNSKLSRRIVAQTIAEKLIAEPKRQGHWLKVLAAYIVEQKQIDTLDLYVHDIAHEYFAQSGQLLVSITSARPLSDVVREELQRYLRAQTQADHVHLNERIDPSLLGGVIARTPDGILDTSVKSQLKRLSAIK